jgi:hypothetical protein
MLWHCEESKPKSPSPRPAAVKSVKKDEQKVDAEPLQQPGI